MLKGTHYPFVGYPHAQHFCHSETSFLRQVREPGIILTNEMGMVILIQPENMCCIWIAFDSQPTRAATSFGRNLPSLLWISLLVLLIPSCALTSTYLQ